ncbi:hypothetical protein [Amaricoccus macauensis]|uniref:hypothetical protein n=1 Tax=Amaricoccus macauensis TaxID=57001 RepID=UPI003C7C0543
MLQHDPIQFLPQEVANIDTSRILVLRQSVGDERCREIIEEVVYHLSERLTKLETALHEWDGAEMRALASRLASLSEQVGLADFARVSRDLCQCIDAEDPIATGAVAARLLRLGDESILSVMLYADQAAL